MGKRARARGYALKDTPTRQRVYTDREAERIALRRKSQENPREETVEAERRIVAANERLKAAEDAAVRRRGRRTLQQIQLGNVTTTDLALRNVRER